MRRMLTIGLIVAVTAVVAVLAWVLPPRFNEPEVQRRVMTTLQQEAAASFLVTGTLQITVTQTVEQTEHAFPRLAALVRLAQPNWPELDAATAQAVVRVPGRVSYGFDVGTLRPEAIQVEEKTGRVMVRLPELAVHSVEPFLGALEIKTASTSWMRLFGDAESDARQQALASVQDVFRTQARQHLNDAAQPRINTAEALRTMLTPALVAAGVPNPQVQFRIGPERVMVPRE